MPSFFDLKSLFRDFSQDLFHLFFQVECVVVEKLDSMINGIKLSHMFLHDKKASTCLKIIVNKKNIPLPASQAVDLFV